MGLGMTVGEAKGRMTYVEAQSWAAFFESRGLPTDMREEVRRGFALIAATLVNVNGGFKGKKAATVEDFMPKRSDEGEASIEAVAAILASASDGSRRGRSSKRAWRR